MGTHEKSPARVAIEADVLAYLQGAARPCSADELYQVCDAADDKVTMARIIGHMREAGTIVRDADIAPGEPGGMPAKTKGSRAVASYRLPSAAEAAARVAGAALDAVADEIAAEYRAIESRAAIPVDQGVIGQGKSAEILAAAQIAPPPTSARPSAFDAGYRPPEDIDTAGSSTNGDEYASPWAHILADGDAEDHRWESDLLQACETSREALITIADQLLAGHPVWSAARSVDRRIQRLADDYV